MVIFTFNDYKSFVRKWVALRPQRGRGQYRKMAAHIGVSSTLISQCFNGEKDLTQEQACELAEFLGLNPKETAYFLLLVDHARAGSAKLKKMLKAKIDEEQKRGTQLVEVVKRDTDLSDAAKATYYSSWLYTGIRNLSALGGMDTVPALADRLQIPRAQIERVLDFLLKEGLCVTDAKGRLQPGHRRTHTGADSSLVIKHHQNWRLRAFDKMVFPEEQQLFYTAPMSLSKADAQMLRAELVTWIKRLNEVVSATEASETVRCLTIDWFEF